MGISVFPDWSAAAETITHSVQFVGGTTAVTKVADTGQGITVTYISTGIVDLTWSDNPGMLLNVQTNFQATTASALKGYTCVPGVFNTATLKLRLNITGDGGSGAPALVDLAALQWLHVLVVFKRSGSGV